MAWDAPAAPRPLPPDVLDRLRADPDYQYSRDDVQAAVSWTSRFRRWLLDRLASLFDGADADAVSRTFNWVLYGLAALVLGWALLKLLKMDVAHPFARRDAAAPAEADLADAARPAADLTTLLADAARAGRYREAVRWHYLRLLGGLGRAGLLDLQPSKTNRRYRADLAGHALGPDFARASRLFDRVVYGGAELDAERYALVAERLDAAEAAFLDLVQPASA